MLAMCVCIYFRYVHIFYAPPRGMHVTRIYCSGSNIKHQLEFATRVSQPHHMSPPPPPRYRSRCVRRRLHACTHALPQQRTNATRVQRRPAPTSISLSACQSVSVVCPSVCQFFACHAQHAREDENAGASRGAYARSGARRCTAVCRDRAHAAGHAPPIA